ncbi:transposase [Chryseobacterium sp. 52]|uniref:transposase n=1 Tax=Chryseobacterium sp. 52 TaxID=2035213 RepID=UPI000C181491|nr:transposase [Chryseobacterium sp. 52]
MNNFKQIHIGSLIKQRKEELDINTQRICNFLNCSVGDIDKMYLSEDLSTSVLLRWSKLLEYDFFRIYSQHLILYSPPSSATANQHVSKLPQFRKNIYTKEVIDFVLELIKFEKKSKLQIIEEYRIPKTTLHKWINKYNKEE